MRKIRLGCVIAVLVAAAVPAHAVVGDVRRPIFDIEEDCSALPPAAYSIPGISDDDHTVVVDLLILLDGVKQTRARQLLTKAASAYADLNIELAPRAFRRLRLVADASASAGGRPTIEVQRAIAAAKALVGGKRPDGVDIVHVLTNKDLTLPTYGAATMGAAECAGGIQWDDKAFSISEDPGQDEYSLDAPGLTQVMDAPAEVVAHEIGHLLGGLHQQANCVQGLDPADAAQADPSACTVMVDAVDLASLRFGVVESAVIRGYAVEFADS